MKQVTIIQQKLMSLSKSTRVVFQIFLCVVFLIAIIPWLFPTFNLSWYLLGIQDAWSAIYFHHPHDTEKFLSSMSLASKGLGFIGSLFTLFPLWMGGLISIKLLKNYSKGEIFSLKNSAFYRQLGIVYLFNALLIEPTHQMFFDLSADLPLPSGDPLKSFAVYGWHINTLIGIFFAMILIIIGYVMKLAQRMKEEEELTI